MTRPAFIGLVGLVAATGLTLAPDARAQAPATTPATSADPGTIQSPPLPRMATTPARDLPAALPPETNRPGIVPAAPTAGVARTSPSQLLVLPTTAGEPAGVTPPSRVNLTPTTPSEIASAQFALQGLGLYRGPINGSLTGPTRAAVRTWQAQTRLPVTGHLDARTSGSLGVSSDGALTDPAAVQAIEHLQLSFGLPVTGQVDEATQELLQEGFIPQEDGLPTVRFRDSLPLAGGSP